MLQKENENHLVTAAYFCRQRTDSQFLHIHCTQLSWYGTLLCPCCKPSFVLVILNSNLLSLSLFNVLIKESQTSLEFLSIHKDAMYAQPQFYFCVRQTSENCNLQRWDRAGLAWLASHLCSLTQWHQASLVRPFSLVGWNTCRSLFMSIVHFIGGSGLIKNWNWNVSLGSLSDLWL